MFEFYIIFTSILESVEKVIFANFKGDCKFFIHLIFLDNQIHFFSMKENRFLHLWKLELVCPLLLLIIMFSSQKLQYHVPWLFSCSLDCNWILLSAINYIYFTFKLLTIIIVNSCQMIFVKSLFDFLDCLFNKPQVVQVSIYLVVFWKIFSFSFRKLWL